MHCPFCGGTRLGGVGSGVVHCYDCQLTFEEEELDDYENGADYDSVEGRDGDE